MSEAFQTLSDGLAGVVASAGPAIVRIEARRHTPGSGILWSADGLVVTASHVVRRDDNITVGLSDGQTAAATLVGRDPSTDLAVLRVEGATGAPLSQASEAEMSVGHLALALARPGRTVQAALGVVSALGDGWRTPMGGQIDRYLATDVVMYPGFSGGPLVGANGRLLGLNTSGLGGDASLAIPAGTLNRVVEALRSHGRVRRGYLGISTQRARLPEGVAEQVGQKTGLLIVAVESGSLAEAAGLTLGDTLLALSGKSINTHEDLLAALSGDVVGQKEVARVLRGGQAQEVSVKIGERE